MTPLLAGITGPADLRRLPADSLPALAAEIRVHLIESVSATGGHLGPNLGVVELTLALHRVFDSPRDALVWDTGHQAYVHKMLTGRAHDFDRLRQAGGLSGYPSRAESDHDLVENSHASTALSYADGLAKAFALQDSADRAVVAVVGDGALTGGMAWEALNNIAAVPERPVIVVLNDNGRSYSPTVGALATHLTGLRKHPGATSDAPDGASLFAQLGLAYLGPVDGHDIGAVEATLREARDLARPVVVHALTQKGRGHRLAEADEVDHLHTVAATPTGPTTSTVTARPAWSDLFADELVALGAERADVVAVVAAMLGPTGVQRFADRFPDRVFDVGIAEQHALTSAAGLAMGGLHPVVCLYSTFLTRGLDQLLMDVALHRLPVTIVLDRAGVTGNDGPSHHGMWDLSLLGMVPGMRVAAPRDGRQLRTLLHEAAAHPGPGALRFPKGETPDDLAPVGRIGAAEVLAAHLDADVLLLPVGTMSGVALEAATDLEGQGIGVSVVDPRWVLPVDPAVVAAAAGHALVVTVEDNGIAGGYGDALGRALRAADVRSRLLTLGLRQEFLTHGGRGALLREQGLDAAGVAAAVTAALGAPAERWPAVERALG